MSITERELRGIIRTMLESSRVRRDAQRAVTGRHDELQRTARTAYSLVAKNGVAPPRFGFTMTSIEKVGINPMSRYNTPIALYAYPVTLRMVDKLLGGTYRNIRASTRKAILASVDPETDSDALYNFNADGELYVDEKIYDENLPFAADAPYINFFEFTDLTDVFYTTTGMSAERYRQAIDALLAWFRSNVKVPDHLDTFKRLLVKAQEHNSIDTPGKAVHAPSSSLNDNQRLATIWTLSRAISFIKGGQDVAETLSSDLGAGAGSQGLSSIWRSLLLTAGVKAVVDDAGTGLIHESEPTQMAIMDTSIVKVLNRFENKTPARVTRAGVPDKEKIEGQKKHDETVSDAAAREIKSFTKNALLGHGTISDLNGLMTFMRSDRQLAMIKRKINTADLITAIWEIGVAHPVRNASHIHGYVVAYVLTQKDEVIDLLLSNLDDPRAFYEALGYGLIWHLPGNEKRDFVRLALQKIALRYTPKTESEVIENYMIIHDFASALRPSDGNQKMGDFSFSLFLETFRPMLNAIAELTNTPIQKFVDELASVWQAESKLKSKTAAEEELKSKKAQKKLDVTPKRLQSLVPEEPKEDIMRWFDHSYGETWRYISDAKEQVEKLDNPGWFQKNVYQYKLLGWFDSVINNINYHIGSSGKSGSKLVAAIKEYQEEITRIMKNEFNKLPLIQQIMQRIKDDPGFSEDDQEDELFKIKMKERKHDLQRIEAIREALKKLKVDFTANIDNMVDKEKETRAQTPVYETQIKKRPQ